MSLFTIILNVVMLFIMLYILKTFYGIETVSKERKRIKALYVLLSLAFIQLLFFLVIFILTN
ncbi:hypothetical protein CPT_Machias_264 [Staphylococcus phage Machias]|nr:hypothetical protein CPT_Machias_264 [Staphylococcus phage Machias]WPH64204.1 hypothetical protein [Staphylococcus phage vB_StaM_PB50]